MTNSGSVDIYCGHWRTCSYILLQSSTLIVHLYFSSSLSFMFFWRPKERKAPAHLKSSPPFLCSGVAGRHPSVKKVLPLEPFCWFLGDADLPQLVTRQGERLTSGRTYLSLNPKITRVQVVSFNGAGFSLILPLYAWSSRSIPLQR